MKYISLLVIASLLSCTKEKAQTVEQVKPVLIQIQAEHTDGQIVTTPIVLVR